MERQEPQRLDDSAIFRRPACERSEESPPAGFAKPKKWTSIFFGSESSAQTDDSRAAQSHACDRANGCREGDVQAVTSQAQQLVELLLSIATAVDKHSLQDLRRASTRAP